MSKDVKHMILVNGPRWMWKVLCNRDVKPEIAQTRDNEREEQMLLLCMAALFFVDIWFRILGSFYNHDSILRFPLSHISLFYLVFLLFHCLPHEVVLPLKSGKKNMESTPIGSI